MSKFITSNYKQWQPSLLDYYVDRKIIYFMPCKTTVAKVGLIK